MEKIILTAKDGYHLHLAVFEAEHPLGYIQVLHGMEEHKERYETFAKRMCAAGYTVITSDMRGHGEHAPVPGFFREKDGCRYLLSDQVQITNYIKKRFGAKKIMIFAHSMGTIIARNLLRTQSQNYEKMVLSGYPNDPGALSVFRGFFLTNVLMPFVGPFYHSTLVQYGAVGVFHKKIPQAKTPVDWICSDEKVVQQYLKDPYCGHGFTISAFRDLFVLTTAMHQRGHYRNVNTALPILLIRGTEDPCTGFDRGAKESARVLRRAGFSKLTEITYPRMRHELLNEKENEKVYADIIGFYKKP